MPRVFHKEKSPADRLPLWAFCLSNLGSSVSSTKLFYGYRFVFPLIEPNALFYLLHTDRLVFFYKDMNFTIRNRPNQPNQLLLLGGQFYALFCIHTSPDFLFNPNICVFKNLALYPSPDPKEDGYRWQSILQAGARGYASHIIAKRGYGDAQQKA